MEEKYKVTVFTPSGNYVSIVTNVETTGIMVVLNEVGKMFPDGTFKLHSNHKKIKFLNCAVQIEELTDEYFETKRALSRHSDVFDYFNMN